MRLRFIYFCFASLLSANSVLAQTVSSVTYNVLNGTLSVTGENFQSLPDPATDIDATKITITGNGGAALSHILDVTSNVNILSSTNFSIILNAPEKAIVDAILNRNGLVAWDGTAYRIDFAETWNAGTGVSTFSTIEVSGVVSPEIASANFSFGDGRLTITGNALKSLLGINNDIDVTRLTISNGTSSYTLTNASSSGDLNASSIIVYLSGIDKAMVNYILNRDGVNAESGTPYNLSANDGWNGLSEPDLTLNTITVTGYQKPQISNVTYNASSGILKAIGSFFAAVAGANNDVDITKIQIYGYGPASYTLALAANPDVTDENNFEILLTGNDKTQADILLNRNGLIAWDETVYSLNLAEAWNCAITGIVDNGNAINVSNVENHPPQARTPNIAGNFINGETLLLSFNYFDFEGDAAGPANIQWFTYTNSAGDGKTPLPGATGTSFTLRTEDIGLYINAEITPSALTGGTPGTTAISPVLGPVLNAAPYANPVTITGDLYLKNIVTGSFGYNDREGNPIGTCTYKWYRADDINGPDNLIIGQTNINYEITSSDLNSYISFEVTPVALSGTLTGVPVRSSRFQVLNEAPKANSVTFTGSMYRGQLLTGSYLYSDLEDDQQGSTSFQWYRADNLTGPDVAITNATSTTYTLTLEDVGKYISFSVTPVAQTGTLTGTTSQSLRVLVLNEKPVASAVVISTNRYLGQTITATYQYSDLENNSEGISTFKWYRADNIGGPDTEIAGANTVSYKITSDDLNRYLSFEVVPVAVAGASPGDPARSERLPVLNEAPKAENVDFSGNMYLSQQLTGSYTYFDLESDGQGTSTFKWFRADDINGPDVEILNATQLTYTLTSNDLNKFISFEVTPISATGTAQGTSVRSARKAVLNEAPKANSVTFSGNMYRGQLLTGNYTYSDLESDGQGGTTFQWYRAENENGPDVDITNATTSTYTLTLDDLGKYISFSVTPRAITGTQTGSTSYSSRALVLNEKPKAVSVYISGNMYLNQDISGNYTYSDLENDQQGTSTFKWYRADSENGPDIEIPGATQTTYRITTDDLNKYLSFTVWPVASTGTPNGDPVQSVRLAVKNEKPKASLVDFTGDIYLSKTVTGSYTFSDLENDGQGTSTFKWYRADNINGPDVEIIGATQLSYTITSADLNKYISFEVTPVAVSGTLQGDPVKSARKAVLNEAPKGSLLKVTGNLVLDQVISADYTYSDLENDQEGNSEYQWFIADGVAGPDSPISGAVSKTFTITRPYLGKYLSYTVIPKALTGTITGESKTSERFYVNAAPVGTAVSISGTFKLKQELQGTFTYTDAENNQEGISEYHWYRANSPEGLGKEIIVGANTRNYTIQSEDMNKYLSFEYTPKANSGSLIGLPVASPFMGPVTNSEPVATNVRISGTQLVCKTIRGEYNFEDLEGDPEGNSQYRWLRAASASGTKTVIAGAVNREYVLTTQDQGMYLFFEVIPRAISGTTTGTATLSSPTGSIVNALPTVTILGTSSICNGSTARLTISFTGSAPWKLTYSDGTERRQIVSSDPVYFLNVSKAGTYKGDTLTDNIGCPVTDLPSTATISILPLPDVQILGLNSAYNYRGNPVPLTGSPAGGTFSGPGVIPSTSMFYPSIAGTQNSPHTIIYEYRSSQTGCLNRDTAIVEVIDADASISGFRPAPVKYCNFDQPFTITGTNAVGTTGTFAITGGVGLTDNNNNTATIHPELLQAGNYTVSYSYFDGIQLSIYKDFTIEVLDEARIFGINNSQYCNNIAPIELSGNYIGGVFSGSAIFQNSQTNKYYFNPSLDSPGNSSITYAYTTSYGCVISSTVEKFIAPVPVAEFSIKNGCFNGDSTAFKNNTISTAEIKLWSWQFGDPQSTEANNRSALFEPKHKYAAIGNRNVRLIAENIYGCKDTIIKSIHLGDIPKADFSWNSECYVKGKPFSFKNKTSNIDDIIQYSWTIEDTSSLNFNYTTIDILHTFPVIRNYWVKFKVTSEYGCSDSVRKTISLRPIHYLEDTLYSNNFEAGKGYWLPTDSLLVNNWKWGTPDGNKIKDAAEGTKAFYTSLKDTRKNQQLVITSPCFNFKNTDRPYITMETFTDAVKGEEGTVLQYSVNNGEVWENVGGYKTGINWYNDFAIQSQPAGQQIGWTDRYLNWANARHNLDFLKNDTLVRFRIVFGQNSKASGTDGFAFDNIVIANRSKKVLFEHFTNNSQFESLSANAYLDSVVSKNKSDAISIQYHTSFPGIDTFNIHNPSDPGSRVLYYGIGVTPLALLDGNEANYKYDFSAQKKPNSNDIKNLALKDNIFDLKIMAKISNERVSGSLHITALKPVSGKTISARVVIVENIVSQTGGYQIIYSNVVKKILPSAGGYTLSPSWEKGKTDSISFSWDNRNVYIAENISIVAFLQDEMTREIYQTTIDDTSKVIIGTGKRIKKPAKEWDLNVYPNPAREWLAVEFPEVDNDNMRIEIWSIGGKAVVSEKLLKGVSRYEKEIQDLENGFYFVRLFDRNRVLATKKFIVVH